MEKKFVFHPKVNNFFLNLIGAYLQLNLNQYKIGIRLEIA